MERRAHMGHNHTELISMAHCVKNKLQLAILQPMKCTPIAETTPVLHQYGAKWVRNITQDMNFNMTLIEPSSVVHLSQQHEVVALLLVILCFHIRFLFFLNCCEDGNTQPRSYSGVLELQD